MLTKSALILLAVLFALSNANVGMQVKKKDLWTVVTLRNNGAYVARLKATYINNGKMEEQNTGSFPVGQSRSLTMHPESRSVVLQGELNMFVNSWKPIFTEHFPVSEMACYTVWGVTWSPSYEKHDC